MDVSRKLQEAIRLEREGKLEAAIRLYGKVWRAQSRPRSGTSIEGMWRLGMAIFDERRSYLERALAQTKLTPTMEEGLLYLCDVPQSLSLLSEYFYEEKNEEIFRSNTIKAIGLLDDPRRIQFLSDVLQHPNEKFRIRAVYAIQQDETPAVIAPLKKAVRNSCLEVRFMAIYGLYQREQAQALAVALQQCETREEQYRIIHFLGRLKCTTVAPLLQKFLQVPDRELICLSADALAEIEDTSALPLLRELALRFPQEARICKAYQFLRRKSHLQDLS